MKKMNKENTAFAVLLAMALMLGVAGCSADVDEAEATPEPTEEVVVEVEPLALTEEDILPYVEFHDIYVPVESAASDEPAEESEDDEGAETAEDEENPAEDDESADNEAEDEAEATEDEELEEFSDDSSEDDSSASGEASGEASDEPDDYLATVDVKDDEVVLEVTYDDEQVNVTALGDYPIVFTAEVLLADADESEDVEVEKTVHVISEDDYLELLSDEAIAERADGISLSVMQELIDETLGVADEDAKETEEPESTEEPDENNEADDSADSDDEDNSNSTDSNVNDSADSGSSSNSNSSTNQESSDTSNSSSNSTNTNTNANSSDSNSSSNSNSESNSNNDEPEAVTPTTTATPKPSSSSSSSNSSDNSSNSSSNNSNDNDSNSSSSSSSTASPTPTPHVHTWENVAETGEYITTTVVTKEAYDEYVGVYYYCNKCGAAFTNEEEICDHELFECESGYSGPYDKYIHHDEETEDVTEWVVTDPAHQVCTTCGATQY